jgi:hypothetical protein
LAEGYITTVTFADEPSDCWSIAQSLLVEAVDFEYSRVNPDALVFTAEVRIASAPEETNVLFADAIAVVVVVEGALVTTSATMPVMIRTAKTIPNTARLRVSNTEVFDEESLVGPGEPGLQGSTPAARNLAGGPRPIILLGPSISP